MRKRYDARWTSTRLFKDLVYRSGKEAHLSTLSVRELEESHHDDLGLQKLVKRFEDEMLEEEVVATHSPR